MVKYLLTTKGYTITKVIPGFQFAVAYNHSNVVQAIFEHHFDIQSNESDENDDEQKIKDNDTSDCIFFSIDSLAKIIINKNRKILDLVLKYDKWPLIKDGQNISNAAIYDLFHQKGNLYFVKFFIEKVQKYKDETIIQKYLNYPLMRHECKYDSTLIHACIKGNRWNSLQYLFIDNPTIAKYLQLQPTKSIKQEEHEDKEEEKEGADLSIQNISPPSPLLLSLVFSGINAKSLPNIEKYAKILLDLGADINWFPNLSLSETNSKSWKTKLVTIH